MACAHPTIQRLAMSLLSKDLLSELGRGNAIDAACRRAGLGREEFLARWLYTAAVRLPETAGSVRAAVGRRVEITRDVWGIPHIYAEDEADLFFGFGYAMAQDRLFQLDWLRRKGAGRLAEILGDDGLPQDVVARTVGLNRIARTEWERLPEETQRLLGSFSAGINAVIEARGDKLPIEFDLLDYRPEPWQPIDCLLIENEFRWYLTGRLPVIAIPELARRQLGQGPLYRAFLSAEADAESILRPGEYAGDCAANSRETQPARYPGEQFGTGGQADAGGSNNWVVHGGRTQSGRPAVASDPHIAIEAVSCWYEVHLQGGGFDIAGMAYAGMPAILIGRNRRVCWGITNNICSQRDLYQEQSSAEHPGCFLYDGHWLPARELTERFAVRGSGQIEKRIVISHNGPIVDEILPVPANQTGPVALKWLGAEEGGSLTALLAMNCARDCDAFREALRPWHVPTFSVVFADVDGKIGYQAAGRIPIRNRCERGYRPGWDPEHQWQGLIPFEAMPGVADPSRGFIVSANNRVAADDFPYPLAGTWSSGQRARRIRQSIETRTKLSPADHRAIQHDVRSLRAVDALPALCAILEADSTHEVREAAACLAAWNADCLSDEVAPSVFNVFFVEWCGRVAAQRFAADAVPLIAPAIEGLAAQLLHEDRCGWFGDTDRKTAIRETFRAALSRLCERLGSDPTQWTWGRLHRLDLKHVLASRGDLGALLNQGGAGVEGDATTVCNTGRGPHFEASIGAGYRMICDLGQAPAGLWAVDCQSQSGHPGSPHYRDQFQAWRIGEYHFLPLDRQEATRNAVESLTLEPDERADGHRPISCVIR